MTPERFRQILTHADRSLSGCAWRMVLETIRPFYALGVWWRNRQFDRRPGKIFHASVPVLSVGNLTLGGTGKSPAVRWFVREFQRLGLKPAVLSRGYKAKKQAPTANRSDLSDETLNDEGREMARLLPGVPLLQNPNRCESAEKAVYEFGAQVLVLDDGFQHRKLFRDLDVVLIDADEPFGLTGRLFPCGTLREPAAGFQRADVLMLTHADRLSVRDRHTLQEEIDQRFPALKNRLWVETIHQPAGFVDAAGNPVELAKDGRYGAFCGIGKPEGFFRSLEEFGLTPAETKIFPDHHAFSDADVSALAQWREKNAFDALLCTEKDLVKLPESLKACALRIDLAFLSGEEELKKRLTNFLDSSGV